MEWNLDIFYFVGSLDVASTNVIFGFITLAVLRATNIPNQCITVKYLEASPPPRTKHQAQSSQVT